MRPKGELLLSVPTLLWLCTFFLVPALIIFAYAFKPANIYGGIEEGWTLQTIKEILTPYTARLAFRTLSISLLATTLSCLLALPMGYFISRCNTSLKKLLLLLTILPFWSSFIIRVYAWKALLHPDGFIKQTFVFIGLMEPGAILLYNQTAVIIAMIYSYLPFAVLPIYTASERFDFQLLEASQDLGLSRLQSFVKIFIPGIAAGIGTAFVMVFIPSIGAYIIPDVIGGFNSEMIGNKIMQRTFIDRNLPQASALSLFLVLGAFLPMLLVALLQLKTKRKRIMVMRSKI